MTTTPDHINQTYTHAMQEVDMECATIGEMVDTEIYGECFDFDTLVSLYGDVDIYLLDADADRPLDYDAAIQEQSLEPLFAD